VGDDDDTLDQGGEVLQLILGGKDITAKAQESCEEALQGLEEVKEQMISGSLSSIILLSVTADGRYSSLLMSKNRFEIIGLGKDLCAMIDQELGYKSKDRN